MTENKKLGEGRLDVAEGAMDDLMGKEAQEE